MEVLFATISNAATDPRLGGADSFCDRLNCTLTVYLLVTFALMMTGKIFVGEPIACYCPAHFTSSQVEFTNKVCWTTNTYYLPFNSEIPKEAEPHKYISYYQWVPLILTCQAVLFYLPRPIWRLLNKKSGIAVSTITDAAIECQRKTDPDERDKVIRYMCKHMGRFLLELHKNYQMADVCKAFWLTMYGNYLFMMYVVIKMLYVANVIGQLFILDRFLGPGYSWYGPTVASKMIHGQEWSSSERFPRVTLCDFKIRLLGNVHRYTVQCSLPMNLFNEIIFIFIWFWFAFVTLATIASLVTWIIWAVCTSQSRKYVTTRLVAMEELEDLATKKTELGIFVNDFLKRDGCFILRMVAKNASDIIAAELVVRLWNYFMSNRKHFKEMSSEDRDIIQQLNDSSDDENGET